MSEAKPVKRIKGARSASQSSIVLLGLKPRSLEANLTCSCCIEGVVGDKGGLD